jgi:hypothetical protein
MKKLVFITIILFLCTSSLLAKVKQERCGGIYAYTYSGSISYDEARTKAIENAIVMALADKFGTTVTAQSLLELTNSGDRFDQMSRLQVKGKLMRHINPPVVSEPVYADNMFTLNVTVDFYAVPIEYAPVEFVAKTLRNGTTDRYESSEYVAGDRFAMSFNSPKAGYIAVFFEDRNTVVCILPYIGDDDLPFRVGKDKRHIFFENDENGYQMTCGEEQEINYVHVVFSPNPFINADLMRTMTRRKFNRWLEKHLNYDSELQVQTLMIRVLPDKEQ